MMSWCCLWETLPATGHSITQHCPATPTLTWGIRTSSNASFAPTSPPHTVPQQPQAGASASPGWAGSQQGRMPMLGSRTWPPASLARAESWGRCNSRHTMPTRPPLSNGHRVHQGAPACPGAVSPQAGHCPGPSGVWPTCASPMAAGEAGWRCPSPGECLAASGR